MHWFVVSILACGPQSADPDPAPVCSAECPVGTRIAAGTEVEVQQLGGFVLQEASCEALCEPFQPCLAPNIPTVVVNQEGTHVFSCNPLEGFAELPDLSALSPADGAWLAFPTADPASVSGGLGGPATWSAVGDFNGDGVEDVVVGDGLQRATLLGGVSPIPAVEPVEVFAADAIDIDRDGQSELLVYFAGPEGRISVRVERWAGAWISEPTLFDTGMYPAIGEFPEAADLDDDGWVDLVLLVLGGPTQGPNVAFGGPAGFGPLTWVGVQPCPDCLEQMWVGDLDGNGLLDLAGRQPVFLDTGRSWRSGGTLPDAPGPCVAADIDGDGRDDAICQDVAETIVRQTDGLGGLPVVATLPWACLPPLYSTVVHDLDGDGTEEVWSTTDCEDTLALHPLDGLVELRPLGLERATLVAHEGRLLGVTP